jgi:glycosyltransferase involved in cell wall biosynthesis
MPCYNHEKYVGEAIKSVLSQTHRHLELHIINDGSTDRSGEEIKPYLGDARVRYYALPQNTSYFGPVRMYESIVASTSAKYVALLASDDMWKKQKLEKQIEVLENNPRYKACFTWDEVIYEEGAQGWRLPENYSALGNMSRYEWFYFFFLWGNRINACSMLIDKAVYQELGGYDPNFRAVGDLYLWMLLATRHPFYLLPEKLTYYRRHAKNLSTADGVSVQLITEDYILSRRLITEMDKDFFAKAFSENIYYTDLDDPRVLAAEKIILLFSFCRREYDQVAIELYIEYSKHKGFVTLMETRYGLTTRELGLILRRCGLASAGGVAPLASALAPLPGRAAILMRDMAQGSLTPESLRIYSWGFLLDALSVAYKSGAAPHAMDAAALKNNLYAAQKRLYESKSGRTVAVIVGEGAAGNFDFILPQSGLINPGSDSVLYCLLPKRASIFGDAKAPALPAELKVFEIFSKEEHFIYSCIDKGVRPDMLVLVGCISDEYSWEYILKKYPMDILITYLELGETPPQEPEHPIKKYLDRLYSR